MNSPEPSDGTYFTVEHLVYRFLLPLICLPGIAAASLSAITFARMRNTSLEILLCGLSVFDVLLLSCTLLIYPIMNICMNETDQMNSFACHFFWKSAILTFPLSVIAQTGSVWTCVAVTLDRFIAVSYPIKKRVICTTSTSFYVLMGIACFSVVFKIPAFLEVSLNSDGQLINTELRRNPLYLKIYMTYLYTIVLVVIPWTIIIVLNVIVIQKVRQAYQVQAYLTVQRTNSNRCRREEGERKVTVMAIVMTGIFILCNIPPTLCNMVESYAPSYSQSFRPIIPLSNLLVCVNSASNTFIYCIFNQKFRRAMLKSFRKKEKLRSRCSASIVPMPKKDKDSTLMGETIVTTTDVFPTNANAV